MIREPFVVKCMWNGEGCAGLIMGKRGKDFVWTSLEPEVLNIGKRS